MNLRGAASIMRVPLRLALVVLGSAALAGAEMKLVEVHPTYGRLGSTRPDTRVLPGEDLSMSFVVSGISKGSDGRAEISRSSELVDDEGNVVAKVLSSTTKASLALGGDAIASYVHFSLPLDFPAGKYRVRGMLTDLRTGAEIVALQPYEVLPPDFGIVRLRLAGDADGANPLGGNLTVNQDVHVLGRGIGFARKGGRIRVVGNMTIRDAAGKPTMPAPITSVVDQEVDDELDHLDFNWSMVANRPGRFAIQIELRDEIAGKRALSTIPLNVATPPTLEKPSRP